jgi:peptide/nickel transport system permease protein
MSVALPAARIVARPARSVWPARLGMSVVWAVLAVIVLAAVWPGLLTRQSPTEVDPIVALAPPSADHLFGTDQLGRDVFARVVHGTGLSLSIGLGATAIAVALGTLFGVLAAVLPRAGDELIMRVTDVFMAFPGLLLSLVVVVVLGPSTVNAMLALGVSFAPGMVRLARGQALVVRESGYVQAARLAGRRPAAIYVRHVIPNAVPSLLVLATVNIGAAIIAGSSLSFLGLGPPPPTPTWGSMINDGSSVLQNAPWVTLFPGLAITLTVLGFSLFGDGLRDALDVRLRDR